MGKVNVSVAVTAGGRIFVSDGFGTGTITTPEVGRVGLFGPSVVYVNAGTEEDWGAITTGVGVTLKGTGDISESPATQREFAQEPHVFGISQQAVLQYTCEFSLQNTPDCGSGFAIGLD